LSGFGARTWAPLRDLQVLSIEPVALDPRFADEETRHPTRGEGGFVQHPFRPRRILVRTRYLRYTHDRDSHRVVVDVDGRLRCAVGGEPFVTAGMYPGLRAWDRRQPDRAIYVVAQDGSLYASDVTALSVGVHSYLAALETRDARAHIPDVLEICHHSTFVAGEAVRCAGELATDENGRLRFVSNYSGHYKPRRTHLRAWLASLAANGLALDGIGVELVHPDKTTTVYADVASLGG
jgi:hypothetical protein